MKTTSILGSLILVCSAACSDANESIELDGEGLEIVDVTSVVAELETVRVNLLTTVLYRQAGADDAALVLRFSIFSGDLVFPDAERTVELPPPVDSDSVRVSAILCADPEQCSFGLLGLPLFSDPNGAFTRTPIRFYEDLDATALVTDVDLRFEGTAETPPLSISIGSLEFRRDI